MGFFDGPCQHEKDEWCFEYWLSVLYDFRLVQLQENVLSFFWGEKSHCMGRLYVIFGVVHVWVSKRR